MEPENIEVRPELERPGYFKLSYEDLERIDDVESILERGIRLVYGIGTVDCYSKGEALIREADRRGHPAARAFGLMKFYRDTCVECTESAARGHHLGTSIRVR